MFYALGIAPAAEFMREIFLFFPPYIFTLTYGQIARIAGDHLESSSMLWAEGRDYTWGDLFKPNTGVVAVSKTFLVPPIAYNMLRQILNMFIASILTWYLDHIISNN